MSVFAQVLFIIIVVGIAGWAMSQLLQVLP
jgi:hypothetical protein